MKEMLKVMTFNLRIAVECDGINHFDRRLPRIVSFLKEEAPDLVGFQEVNAHMKECLSEALHGYVFVGCGRERDYNGESALIGYQKDRFELIRFENFWLSATPEVAGSRYGFDQSKCPRITSAALLKPRSGGSPFWFVNTHLDHQGKMARLFGAMQILQFLSVKREPSILVGDFNACPDSPEIGLLTGNGEYPLTDCTAAIDGTFHAYSDQMRGKIDYIFASAGCHAVRSELSPDEPVEGVYLSDHRPVGAVIELS